MSSSVSRLGMLIEAGAWRNFRCDFLSAVLISFFSAVFNQFYVPMAIRHGATNVEVGLLSAAPAIGMLLSPFWAGLTTGRRLLPFVIWPNAAARLSLLLVAIWMNQTMFLAIALFVNVMNGIQAPAYAELVTRMYPAPLRGRLMGYVRVALSLVVIPLAYVIGKWSDVGGDRGPLVVAVISGLASLAVFALVRELKTATPRSEVRRQRFSLRKQWETVRSNPALLGFLIATTFAGFGNLLANPLYQIYQIHRLHLTDVEIGYTRMVYYSLLLAAYFVMGWVIDRLGPGRAMYIGIAAYALAPLCYGLSGSFADVLLASGFQGIGDATWDIGCMAYVFRVAPGREAVVFSLHLLLFGVRGTIAPILAGSLSHTLSVQTILIIASAFGWVGMVTLRAMVRGETKPRRRRKGTPTSTDSALEMLRD